MVQKAPTKFFASQKKQFQVVLDLSLRCLSQSWLYHAQLIRCTYADILIDIYRTLCCHYFTSE